MLQVHAAKLEGRGRKDERAKPNWRYSQQLVHFYFFKRLNARLDEAHLLIPSEKVL